MKCKGQRQGDSTGGGLYRRQDRETLLKGHSAEVKTGGLYRRWTLQKSRQGDSGQVKTGGVCIQAANEAIHSIRWLGARTTLQTMTHRCAAGMSVTTSSLLNTLCGPQFGLPLTYIWDIMCTTRPNLNLALCCSVDQHKPGPTPLFHMHHTLPYLHAGTSWASLWSGSG